MGIIPTCQDNLIPSGEKKLKFKDYAQDQLMLIPPSLKDLIDKNHPVHIVNQVLNKIKRKHPFYVDSRDVRCGAYVTSRRRIVK